MSIDIVMPAMEMAQDTAKLVHWLKAEGEFVRKGEPLFLIETDKVAVEIEAQATGTLRPIARAGDRVPVGHVIGRLLSEEDKPTASMPAPGGSVSGEHIQASATPVAKNLAEDHGVDLRLIHAKGDRVEKADVLAYLRLQAGSPGKSQPTAKLVSASPKARRLATEAGVALAGIAGSGLRGAVLAADVQAAHRAVTETKPTVAQKPPAASDEYRVVPIEGVRQVIAQRLQASYQTAPHIALTISADMTEVRRLIERVGPLILSQTEHNLTTTAVLAKVVGSNLIRHSRLNAHVTQGEIHEFASVHLGIAVALDDGLVVPVIRSVERKGLSMIQTELSDLTERARAGMLKLPETKGSTFTLSNLGMLGVEQFTAILNPPEVGILTVGAIVDTPAGIDGTLVLRPIMRTTLIVDHRAVDGATAAAFLRDLKQSLENPYQLLA
ncbi:MAG: 2-oxo acid dehydrogenase subunit E2 [Chloroflexi bacterium]|nr:2-oxo acid dehydrogenase subunit E2 [Chloroflexota bacterium]